MAYKRTSVLVGLPDQDREWESVQAKTFTKWFVTSSEGRRGADGKSIANRADLIACILRATQAEYQTPSWRAAAYAEPIH